MIKIFLLLLFLVNTSSFPQELYDEIFKEFGVNGSIIIYDLNNDMATYYNYKRLDSVFLPASTFKIFNSLVALETGVIKDENEIIKWDGVDRGWSSWNKDHNLRSAIKVSAVWFYQELARRIGEERMQKFINIVDYGNRNIGGGIDMFWLTGDLRITPHQQIDFLKRLYNNNLPFSQRAINIVKDILILEETDNYILRGKTGWADKPDPDIGWFVGYLEQNNNVYFFATNIDILKNEDSKKRVELTKAVLRSINLL